MTLTEFYEASYEDALLIVYGNRDVEIETLKRERMLLWAVLFPWSKKDLKPEKLMPLPGDKNYGKRSIASLKPEDRKKAMDDLRQRYLAAAKNSVVSKVGVNKKGQLHE
jgi:hypothetical protein